LSRNIETQRTRVAVPLTLQTANANAWTVFADGRLVGSGWELGHHGGTVHLGHDDCSKDGGKNITLDLSKLAQRTPESSDGRGGGSGGGGFLLTLLSSSVGIDNGGGIHNSNTSTSSTGVKGITSSAANSVVLGGVDLTSGQPWVHQVGATGEATAVFTAAGAAKVAWVAAGGGSAAPMTWLQARFDAPAAVLKPATPATELKATLNLDATGLSRGRFFVNGFDLGRYWTKLCGKTDMCQRDYPIPFDILFREPTRANVLTVRAARAHRNSGPVAHHPAHISLSPSLPVSVGSCPSAR
jgi:hypothetical protein